MGQCCSNASQQGEEANEITTSEFPTAGSEFSTTQVNRSVNDDRINSSPPSSFDSDYYQRLTVGIETMVIPAARTGIMCTLRFDPKGKRFILRKDQLTRPVNLSSIQRVMHTKKDLRRVEGQAALAEDENCCALLLKTQSCISLRFNTVEDNKHFIETTNDLLLYYNGKE